MGGGCRLVTSGRLGQGALAGLTNEHPEEHVLSSPEAATYLRLNPKTQTRHVVTPQQSAGLGTSENLYLSWKAGSGGLAFRGGSAPK